MAEPDNVAPQPVPRKRLRHRLPRSWRQHWKLVALLGVFSLALVVTLKDVGIKPYITGDVEIAAADITEDLAGTVDLFDPSVDHEVSIDITDVEYDDMVESYQKDGEKKWVTATVTIDGTVINDVAVRLKGNSTLMGLRGTGGAAGEGGPGRGGMQPPEGMELPEGMEMPEGMQMPEGMEPPEGMEMPEGGMAGGPGGGGMGAMSQASADDPTSLPLLLSFNENVEGRAYQGMTEISVRPGSPVINEAMALSLTKAADLPTQDYGYAVYSVNGSDTTTRLLLAHPDENMANNLFDSPGYLYKADASSQLAYVDDDQSSYSDQFKQINASDDGTLQPIIDFLKWMDEADDEEFAADLDQWVDVDSLASYLAMQNLIVNGDDMGGPGQNYYLWYDLDSEKLSVISWDLNLAMQGDATAGPDDETGMGAGMGGGMFGGGNRAAEDEGGAQEGAAPERTQQAGGIRGGNALKERFLASDDLKGVYTEAYWELFDKVYADGTAADTLNGLAESVPTSDSLSAEDLETAIDTMSDWVNQRTSALNKARKE
ncbi:CotH kinase family protein [Nocardioides sp. YIM B13467]|uniref:CotH kinase family protein n=1 Tax=Nocardioides sp. YIM B13467 TaxID=3366294 RepID=UPI0036715DA8